MIAALLLCALVQTPAAPARPAQLDSKATPPARTAGSLPVYPDDARQKRVGGVVTVDVTIDAKGKVVDAKPLRSIPALAAAATDAVRQWTFRMPPAAADGTPSPVMLTIVFYFDADTGRVDEVQRIPAQGPQPKKTRNVPPIYPPQVHSNKAGRVIIEAVVNRAGAVIDIRVVSATGGFESAARDAVRQWEYEPLIVGGTAVPFVLTVTVLVSQK